MKEFNDITDRADTTQKEGSQLQQQEERLRCKVQVAERILKRLSCANSTVASAGIPSGIIKDVINGYEAKDTTQYAVVNRRIPCSTQNNRPPPVSTSR